MLSPPLSLSLSLSLSPFISISQVWYKFLIESRLSSKTRVFCCFILGGFFVGGFYFVVAAVVLAWCGIIVPGPEIELEPWAVKVQNLNHSITREFHKVIFNIKDARKGFHDGSLVKNQSINAGGMRLIPDLVRFPCALEQLSLCGTSTKSVLTETVPYSKGSHSNEKPEHWN